jgi:hypothetical protein
MTAAFCKFAQNRCNHSKRTKVIAKRMDTFSFRARFLANAIPSTDVVAEAEVTQPQGGRVAGASMRRNTGASMSDDSKRPPLSHASGTPVT